jgi:hypothetical protein
LLVGTGIRVPRVDGLGVGGGEAAGGFHVNSDPGGL